MRVPGIKLRWSGSVESLPAESLWEPESRGPAQAEVGENVPQGEWVTTPLCEQNLWWPSPSRPGGARASSATSVLWTGGWVGVGCLAHVSPDTLASPAPEL